MHIISDSACPWRSIWCTWYAQDHQIKISMNWAVLHTPHSLTQLEDLVFLTTADAFCKIRPVWDWAILPLPKSYSACMTCSYYSVSADVGVQVPCTLSCNNDSIMYCVGLAEDSLQSQARSALGHGFKMRINQFYLQWRTRCCFWDWGGLCVS